MIHHVFVCSRVLCVRCFILYLCMCDVSFAVWYK